MKLMLLLAGIVYGTMIVKGQSFGYAETDRVALNLPEAQTGTTKDIAEYINRHFDSDGEKIRAIYTWVTNNIKYDKDSVHLVILEEDNEQRVTYALRRKKGVCENFAAIFNDICIKSGIPSFVIEGYTRQSGSMDRAPHVWCAAFTDGQWFMYDPTWDAGFISNSRFVSSVQTNYFKITPDHFVQSHLPFDPLFQFLEYPVNYREFRSGNSRSSNRKKSFNYTDSIRQYEASDSLTRYLGIMDRISNFGWPFSLIDIKLKRLKLEIELICQDRDIYFYNLIVNDYNEAIEILNKFILYRNNEFSPEKKNAEIDAMFTTIFQKITFARKKLIELNQSTATLALDTGDISKKINDLAAKAKDQNDFFKNYLRSSGQK